MSCSTDDGDNLSAFDSTIQSYLNENNISATRTSSGLYYTAVSVDSTMLSPTGMNQVASIYYNLLSLEGDTISSRQREDGDSLQFKIGANAVYPVALDEALQLMTEGDVYTFIVPPNIGYGITGSAIIEDETIVQIDISLVDIQSEDSININEIEQIQTYITTNDLDNISVNPVDPVAYTASTGLFYKRTSVGTGALPTVGDVIDISYTAFFLDTEEVLDTEINFSFIFGSSQPRPVLSGVELGIGQMQTEETALLLLPSAIAYRESALVLPAALASDLAAIGIIPDYATQVPPYSPLLFVITRND